MQPPFDRWCTRVQTFRDVLISTEQALLQGGVFCGHGYVDCHDEAVALVLAAACRDPESGTEILGQFVDDDSLRTLSDFLDQRIQGRVPTAYITGRAALGGLSFRCDKRALVPRSPLMAVVLDDYRPWFQGAVPRRILDVCCGGGSLGLLAAFYEPDSEVFLMDLDEQALALAWLNLKDHSLPNAFCLRADLMTALAPGTADIILANPPYVDALDMNSLPPEYQHEPRVALAAGEDGLDLVHPLLQQAERVLAPGGVLFLEVGNSAPALEQAYPDLAFTWLALESGGHGVCAIGKSELGFLRTTT